MQLHINTAERREIWRKLLTNCEQNAILCLQLNMTNEVQVTSVAANRGSIPAGHYFAVKGDPAEAKGILRSLCWFDGEYPSDCHGEPCLEDGAMIGGALSNIFSVALPQ